MKQSIKIEIDSWEWIRQKDESYCDENIDNADYDLTMVMTMVRQRWSTAGLFCPIVGEIRFWGWISQRDESYSDENTDDKHNTDYDYDHNNYGDDNDEAEMKHGGVVLPNCGWNDRSPVRTASFRLTLSLSLHWWCWSTDRVIKW